jgi:replicative DNA helicase
LKVFDTTTELQIIRTICDTDFRSKVLARVDEEYFGFDCSKQIFERIKILIASNKPVPTTEVFRNDEALSDETKAFISNPAISPLRTEDDIEVSLEQLGKYRKARLLFSTVSNIVETMQGQDPDLDTVVDSIESTLQKCRSGHKKSEMVHYEKGKINELTKMVMDDLEVQDTGAIPTGFGLYDKKVGGFRRKSAVCMASVPGGGKTAMMLQCAANQYLMGFNVCVVSYEMEEVELRYRLLSSISRIEHDKINLKRLTKMHKELIEKAWREFLESSPSNNRLTIWTPERELNIPEIGMELKAYGYDIVYIDYLGLLKMDPKKQLWEMLGVHARNAKLVANSLNACLVLLAQLDDETNKIKYSKAIIANAHVVWTWENGEKEVESGIIEIKQPKNRSAQPFSFYLQRNLSLMSFCDYIGPPPVSKDEAKDSQQQQTENAIPKMPELA